MSLKELLKNTKPKRAFLIRDVELEVVVPTLKELENWDKIFEDDKKANEWICENVLIKDTGKPAFDNVSEINEVLTSEELSLIFSSLFEKKSQ